MPCASNAEICIAPLPRPSESQAALDSCDTVAPCSLCQGTAPAIIDKVTIVYLATTPVPA